MGVRWVLNRGSRVRVQQAVSRPESLQREGLPVHLLVEDVLRLRLRHRPALLLLQAIDFAAHRHRDQRRKDHRASPYVNHPVAVALLLAKVGGVSDAEVLVAALLHDTWKTRPRLPRRSKPPSERS